MVKASIEFSQVLGFIASHKFTPDELLICHEAFRLAQKRLTNDATRSFQVGDAVQFEDKKGETVAGRVVKVNRKTIQVQALHNGSMWSVSPMLVSKFKKGA